jgi:hypothetical protein
VEMAAQEPGALHRGGERLVGGPRPPQGHDESIEPLPSPVMLDGMVPKWPQSTWACSPGAVSKRTVALVRRAPRNGGTNARTIVSFPG